MPMSPAGGDRHARLRAARRGALGGVRRICRARACGAASSMRGPRVTRLRLVRDRARPDRAVQADGGQGISLSKHKPDKVVVLQRPQISAELQQGSDHVTGKRPWRGRIRRLSCRSPRTILHPTCSTPAGPTGRPQWGSLRDNGGQLGGASSTACTRILRREAGRALLGGQRHRLGGRALVHHLRAALAREHHHPSTRASRWARRTRGAFWRGDLAARHPDAVHGSHGIPRHPPRGSGRKVHPAAPADEDLARALPRRRALAIPRRCSGRSRSCASRWWTIGGRRRPAGPSAPTRSGSRASR